MGRQQLVLAALAVCLGTALACTKASQPLEPSAGANADGSTLKATAPVALSPVNGAKPTTGLELKVTNSAASFPQGAGAPLTYRFEIYNSAGTRVYESPAVPAGSGGTTTHSPNANLTVDQPYQWQARAEYQGAFGPWTARASFVASQNVGFIRANEIYDPLINGQTVGTIHGPVTFLPGVGLRLDDDESYVEYALTQAVSSGEYSALISGLAVISNTEDPKYRVMTMREGLAAINDNRFRMSLDKRGNGAIAYRFITGDANPGQYIESGPGDRGPNNFQRNIWYFWRAIWGGNNFRLTVLEDTPTGKPFYELSRSYKFSYNPNPHMVYIGSPYASGDRGEPSSATGMIIRQVWLSPNPRPPYANQ